MSWLDKAEGRAKSLLDAGKSQRAVQYFGPAAQLVGAERAFRRLAQAGDRESFIDHMASLCFGLGFAELRFDVEFEPTGDAGPDLRVSRDGGLAHAEVRRFHASKEESRPVPVGLFAEDSTLPQYGNPSKDIKKVIDEMTGKSAQITDHRGIIALWSSSERYEETELIGAFKAFQDDVESQCCTLPGGLLFCLFRAPARSVQTHRQMYVGRFKDLDVPFASWAEDWQNF